MKRNCNFRTKKKRNDYIILYSHETKSSVEYTNLDYYTYNLLYEARCRFLFSKKKKKSPSKCHGVGDRRP